MWPQGKHLAAAELGLVGRTCLKYESIDMFSIDEAKHPVTLHCMEGLELHAANWRCASAGPWVVEPHSAGQNLTINAVQPSSDTRALSPPEGH